MASYAVSRGWVYQPDAEDRVFKRFDGDPFDTGFGREASNLFTAGTFPSNLVANLWHFTVREFFANEDPAVRAVPTVDFGTAG